MFVTNNNASLTNVSDNQRITPPVLILAFCYEFRLLHLLKPWFYVFSCSVLFCRQFIPYCTTKYIFWLGKNKFDRIVPL